MKTVKRLALAVTTLILAAIATAATWFYATGGRSFIISTPSMATYAPVGTVVLTRPTNYNTLKVGNTIAFNPPASPETYFHRIHNITPTGIKTKGDLNGTVDPWTITQQNLVGKEYLHIHNLGFLIHALPFLVLGTLILWAITHYFVEKPYWIPARIFGASFILSVAAYFTRPFTSARLLSQIEINGKTTTTFVPTGILSVDGHAVQGTTVTAIHPGQLAQVFSTHHNHAGLFVTNVTPHLYAWQWVVYILICLTPTIVGLAYAKWAKPVTAEETTTEETEPAIATN